MRPRDGLKKSRGEKAKKLSCLSKKLPLPKNTFGGGGGVKKSRGRDFFLTSS